MTRRRSSASGVPSVRRRIALAVLATALLLAGCGSAQPTASAPASPDSSVAPAGTPPASTEPSIGAGTPAPPAPTTPEPEPEPSERPSAAPLESVPPDGPSDLPAESTAAPPEGTGSCSGTPENQAFYRDVAAAVRWSVYCPALPAGWFVQSGQYRLADGGRLEITYRGPGGAGLMLQEGAFCPGGDCVPGGDALGAVAFGDRDGTLLRTADGWAIAVDRGEPVSWLLRLSGVSEEAAREIAADLVRVSG